MAVQKNYPDSDNIFTRRKILLFILFVLLLIWYIAPHFTSQISAVQFKNQYFNLYREFSQALTIMQDKDGDYVVTSINNPEEFVKNFSSLFKSSVICEPKSKDCLNDKAVYSTLDGKLYPKYLNTPNIGQFVLADKTLVILNNFGGNLWINVDINGIKKGPNRLGLDLFTFYVGSKELSLKLMGASRTPYKNLSKYCNPEKSNNFNGLPCSYKAILDQNYFFDMKNML